MSPQLLHCRACRCQHTQQTHCCKAAPWAPPSGSPLLSGQPGFLSASLAPAWTSHLLPSALLKASCPSCICMQIAHIVTCKALKYKHFKPSDIHITTLHLASPLLTWHHHTPLTWRHPHVTDVTCNRHLYVPCCRAVIMHETICSVQYGYNHERIHERNCTYPDWITMHAPAQEPYI